MRALLAIIRQTALVLVLVVDVPEAAVGQGTRPARTVDHRLRSSALPAIEVRVAPDLAYLGSVRYEVASGAHVEAFVFADTVTGRLQRAFIAHFEGYPPAVGGTFRYPRLEMTRLGKHEYLHQTWALAQFSLFEVPAMRAFLRARGLSAEPRWLVDRYVRVVDTAAHHEVIFFYLEAAALHEPEIVYGGLPVAPPPPPAPPAAVMAAVRNRARAAFHVIDP